MAQETEASPHETEIALRRCQSLMAKFGIAKKDLEPSEFGRQSAHAARSTTRPQVQDAKTARAYHSIHKLGGAEHIHFLAAIDVPLIMLG